MARTQSRKRRLLGFKKTSNSASGLASVRSHPFPKSPGRSETRAGDFPSIPEASSLAYPGRLARMRHFFHRSNRGPSTAIPTEVADTQAGGEAQVASDEAVVAAGAGCRAQDQQEQPQTAPTKNPRDNQVILLGRLKSQPPNQNQNPRQRRLVRMSMMPLKNSAALLPSQVPPKTLQMPSVSSIPQFPGFKP
ncbi:hypothetical protein EDD16DRAFT_1729110 [Pisolithus croceorrhizus]|nr:hypothetical protein EDD16DRAFT_1729110 [Pisolithus croceorrhizus]